MTKAALDTSTDKRSGIDILCHPLFPSVPSSILQASTTLPLIGSNRQLFYLDSCLKSKQTLQNGRMMQVSAYSPAELGAQAVKSRYVISTASQMTIPMGCHQLQSVLIVDEVGLVNMKAWARDWANAFDLLFRCWHVEPPIHHQQLDKTFRAGDLHVLSYLGGRKKIFSAETPQ